MSEGSNELEVSAADKFAAAAIAGDIMTLRSMISRRPSICNACWDEAGRSALHRAVRGGQADAVGVLIAHGAEVNVKSTLRHRSPLYDACSKGYTMIASLLIEAGADVNVREVRGRTALYSAAFHNHAATVSLLLLKGANYRLMDSANRSALIAASAAGQLESLHELLSHSGVAEALNSLDASGRSALHYACMGGHAAVAQLLIDAGAIATQEAMISNFDYNIALLPLHAACCAGSLDVVTVLLNSDINVNMLDRNKCTALHMACRSGKKEIASMLLSRGASAGIRSDRGRLPVIEAAIAGDVDLVSLLLDHAPREPGPSDGSHDTDNTWWDINARDSDGRSSLHMACYNGHISIVQLFVQRKPSCNMSLRDNDGHTALHMASQGGRTSLIPILISSGCDFDIRDSRGRTAADMAKSTPVRSLIEQVSHVCSSCLRDPLSRYCLRYRRRAGGFGARAHFCWPPGLPCPQSARGRMCCIACRQTCPGLSFQPFCDIVMCV